MQEAYSVERRGMILDYITVKWKLDNAQRDYWVVNFRRSLIIARLWRPEVERCGHFEELLRV